MLVETSFILACMTSSVEVELIEAIIKIESNGNETAFNVNRWDGETFQSSEPDLAAIAASEFVASGFSVDIGLMQINSNNLKRLGETIETAFDPCINVRLGESILIENIQTARDKGYSEDMVIKTALSLYNTGRFELGFRNGYVNKVWNEYVRRSDYVAKQSPIEVSWTFSTSWVDENIKEVTTKQ